MNEENERIKRIEEFLLDPEKALFKTLEEFRDAINQILPILTAIDINTLTTLKGEDGKTPQRGVEYMTQDDIDALEAFILSKMPRADVDFASIEATEAFIRAEIAKIPRVKGDRGEEGKPGRAGKDGSPDSGADILRKLRALGRNQGLKISDIRGLENRIKIYNTAVDELEALKEAFANQKIVIPANMTGGGSTPGGAVWGTITGTLSDQTDLQTALNLKANSAITISAGAGLTGGGNLSANRTISLDAASIASLALADTALQDITGLITAGTGIQITGTGTSGDPYEIESTGGFTLTNGRGTTANGTAVDLGGTYSTAVALVSGGGAANFSIDNRGTTGISLGDISATNGGAILSVASTTLSWDDASTHANRFGINIVNPDEALHVVGSVKIEDGTEQNGYVFTSDADGVGSWQALPAAGANTALSNLASVAINTTLLPGSNDGAGLGNASFAFSDLFLATGGVINWSNGDLTLTHASGILTNAISNTSTTPQYSLTQASTGDAAMRFALSTTRSYAIGIDNSASDSFIISTAASGTAVLGTGDLFTLTTAGALTLASSATATAFIPSSSTIPTNGMYLPAGNTLGWAINSAGELQLTSTALSPMSDDGLALGTTALGWQSLFGDTGFVINIENGNWVATHTSAILTVGTGDLRVTNAGTNTASVVTVGGSQTLTSKTLTSPTINTANIGGITQLAEGASLALDAALSADGTYSGITIAGTAGATLAFGDLVYLAVADSRWELADADSVTTSDRMLGICVLAAASDGSATRILLVGNIRADAAFPAMTVGAAMYVGETAGDIQVAIPTGVDNVIRRVGYALTADELYFNPSMDSQTTVA